jgi:ParB family chromosome partitioning protein
VVGNIELEIAIEINPFQPRSNFNEESLKELATSIN